MINNKASQFMNKKALAGKALTFIVFIVVIIIMSVFIALSTSISILKTPPTSEAQLTTQNENALLLETISLKIEDKETDILVYDAVYLLFTGEITEENLETALIKLKKETDKCYVLASDFLIILKEKPSGFESQKLGLLIGDESHYRRFKDSLTETTIKVNQGLRKVQHYYGPC